MVHMSCVWRSCAVAVLSTAVLSAQGSQFTSPSGYLTTEGEGRSFSYFGHQSQARTMLLDGEVPRVGTMLKAIAFRHDGSSTQQLSQRTWSNVTLRVADANLMQPSVVFTANVLSTPALVFNASVTWPDLNGQPPTQPAPWGGVAGELAFPFAQVYAHSGARDLSLDFEFRGGLLANSRGLFNYSFDSYPQPSVAAPITNYGTSGSCRETGATAVARLTASMSTCGPECPGPNVFRLSTSSSPTAANRTVVHALGFAGIPGGLAFPGVACNLLFVDPGRPIVFVFLGAGSTGTAVQNLQIPYDPNKVGQRLWIQAGWDDSLSNALKFTNAASGAWERAPRLYQRICIPGSIGAPAGLGSFLGSFYNPLIRYSK